MTGSSAAPPTEARTELDLRRRLALALLVPLYRLYNLTLRFRFHCSEETREILASEGAVVLAYWHEHIATVPWLLRRHGIVGLVSRHRDGEMFSRLLDAYGTVTVRGSTTRGGASALRGLLRALAGGNVVGLTPDGPKGPRRRAQSGAVELARRSGAPIVPVVIEFPRAKRLRSWDRTALPRPFSRGSVHFGEPLHLDRGTDTEDGTARLQERLDALVERAEARFEEGWSAGSRRSPQRRRPPARLEDLRPGPGEGARGATSGS
ncbi:MAG: lysophospholipid acyltransferase family protein [Planctomycetota bacterium]|jgi:lysophospholipid acyltransferase (LPLAT)-like uncharacterized protein